MEFGAWIIWNGGSIPVAPTDYVQIQRAAQNRLDAMAEKPVRAGSIDWVNQENKHAVTAYRVLTQPVVVTLFGHENNGGEWLFKERRDATDTHRIRFRIVNGVVDVANVQMVAAP